MQVAESIFHFLKPDLKKNQLIGEIGIEIKLAQFTKDGVFTARSISDFRKDFIKIKRVKNENKYLIQIAEATNLKKVTQDSIETQVWISLGKQATRSFKPHLIFFYTWKTLNSENIQSNIVLLLWKIAASK